MSAEMGVKPIDERLWNVVDTTVRRLPAAGVKKGYFDAAREEVQSENRASSRAEVDGAEDASRTLENLKDKTITYSENSQPARTGGDEESSVDLMG